MILLAVLIENAFLRSRRPSENVHYSENIFRDDQVEDQSQGNISYNL